MRLNPQMIRDNPNSLENLLSKRVKDTGKIMNSMITYINELEEQLEAVAAECDALTCVVQQLTSELKEWTQRESRHK